MKLSISPPSWSLRPPPFSASLIIPVSLLILGSTLTDGQISSQDLHNYLQYTDGLKTMWTESLKSLYQLSQSFINTITGNGVAGTIFKELGINISDPSTFLKVNLSSLNAGKVAENVAKDGIGYFVIVAIGILLTLFFFLGCGCLFCCRKLGCCCGKVGSNNPKSSDVPVTITLFVVVVAVTVLMFLSAYGSIVSGVTAVDSLKNDNESGLPLVGNILPAVRGLLVFLNRTLEDVGGVFNVTELKEQFGNFSNTLSVFIQEQLQMIEAQCPSCGVLLNDSQLLKSYGINLSLALEYLNEYQEYLNSAYHSFNSTLQEFKNKTDYAIGSCSNDSCRSLKPRVDNLRLVREPLTYNFSNVTNAIQGIKKLDSLQFALPPDLSKKMDNVTNAIFDGLKNQSDVLLGFLRNLDISQFDKKYLNKNASIFANVPWDQVDKISSIVLITLKAVAIAVGAIFFVVVLLNVLGLILGPTCFKQNPKASQKVFLASAQISFTGGIPFSIIAMILFIFGTLAYREGCYDFKKEGNSEYFKTIDKVIQQQLSGLNMKSINISENFTIKLNWDNIYIISQTIMNDCKNNESLAKVLLEVFVIDNNTADGFLNQFDSQLGSFKNFNFSSLPAFSDDVIKKLRDTSSDINSFVNSSFPNFNESLPLLLPPLENITSLMNETLHDGSNLQNKTVMEELLNVDVPIIYNMSKNITSEEKALMDQITEVKEMLGDVSELLLEMANASVRAREELKNVTNDNLIQNLKNKVRNTFFDVFESLKKKILRTAHCREIYDLFNLIFYFFCDLVINPLNAYWFSLGISIALLIPSFLGGLWLGGLFARRHKTLDDLEGSEGDDAEFISPKDMARNQVNGNTKVPSDSSNPIPVMPAPLAAGPGAGYASSPANEPQTTSPIPATPSNNNDGGLENASIYYIPPFPNSQPQSNYGNYAAQDPYYNMPYFRLPQGNNPGRPYSRFNVRIPRPWPPQARGFSPYSRF